MKSSIKLERLIWVEPAKGLAILMVLAYHTLGYLGIKNNINGQMGVDAFLFLSGFGLAYNTRQESTLSFLRRRFFKIFPAYWIVLTFCLVVDTLIIKTPFNFKDALLHFTTLHLIAGGQYSFSINGSFWFMGLITPLYIWYTLIKSKITGKNGYTILGLSILLSCLLGEGMFYWPSLSASAGINLDHVPHRLPIFFIGATVGLALHQKDTFSQRINTSLLTSFITFTLLSTWMIGKGGEKFPIYFFGGVSKLQYINKLNYIYIYCYYRRIILRNLSLSSILSCTNQ